VSFLSRFIDRLFGAREGGARPERLPSPDELVLLSRPEGEPEAELLREMLEGEGIRAMVRNRDAASAQAGGMGPAWAYEVWVLRKDLARARSVIGEPEA